VSHDRAFLDNVVTQVIASEGDGRWIENAGGYDDWAAWRAGKRAEQEAEKKSKEGAAPARRTENGKAKSGRLSFEERKELEGLPARIADLEAEQKILAARLEDPALYGSEPREAQRIAERLGEIEGELMAALERWEALESRAVS